MAKKTTGPASARQAKIDAVRRNGGAGVSKIVVAAVVLVYLWRVVTWRAH